MVTLASDMQDFIPILAIGGGLMLGLVGLVGSIVRRVVVGKAREQSRREIAAYVAEGSMSAEDGAKLMDAGKRPRV